MAIHQASEPFGALKSNIRTNLGQWQLFLNNLQVAIYHSGGNALNHYMTA